MSQEPDRNRQRQAGVSKYRGPTCAGIHQGGGWVKDVGDIYQRPRHSSLPGEHPRQAAGWASASCKSHIGSSPVLAAPRGRGDQIAVTWRRRLRGHMVG